MIDQKDLGSSAKSTTADKDNTYYDFMSLFFLSCYLFSDFLPDFKSIEILGTQFFYFSIINVIVAVYLCKNPVLLPQVLLNNLKKDWIFKVYFLFLSLCALTLFTANNLSLAVVSFTQLLVVFTLFFNSYMLLYNKAHLLYKLCFIISICLFFETSLEFISLFKDLKKVSIFEAIANLKGNSGNINIYAASLSIKIPFLLMGITHYSRFKKVFFLLTLFLVTLTIFLVSARAAYLSMFIIVVVFIFYYLKKNTFDKRYLKSTAGILIVFAASFLTTNAIFSLNKGEGRFESVTNRITQIVDNNESSANARLTYWQTALSLIEENPIVGVGLGNWKIASLTYERTYIDDLTSSSHTHNDFLEIATETGLLNGLIYILLFILLLVNNVKKLVKKEKSIEQNMAIIATLMLISYGIDAMFNFPLYRPTMQFAFALIVALTLVSNSLNEKKSETVDNSIYTKGNILLSVLMLYFTFSTFRAYQLEYKIKYKKISSTEIKERFPTFPNVGVYSESFAEHLAIAYYNEGNYLKATEYFYLAKRINPYLGMPDWYLHKIEKSKGNIDDAYSYAKNAFYLRPRNSNYFLDGINMASLKKDTTEILKIHNLYSSYRKTASNWKNTSSALYKSNYKIKEIIAFVDEGLLSFPKDSSLLKRKKNLVDRIAGMPEGDNTLPNDGLIPPTTQVNYMVEAKKMGDQLKFEKAIELYKIAYKEEEQNKVILQDIGVCYYKLNKADIAIQYLKQTLNNPNLESGKTEYLLAGCYFNLKDKENGCKYLTIAFEKKYPNTEPLINQLCK
jgi:O-antigen ligase